MSAKTKSRIIFIVGTLVVGGILIALFTHNMNVTCGTEFMQQGDTCTTKHYGGIGDGYTSDYATEKDSQRFSQYGFCFLLGGVITAVGMSVGKAVMRKRRHRRGSHQA